VRRPALQIFTKCDSGVQRGSFYNQAAVGRSEEFMKKRDGDKTARDTLPIYNKIRK
jgi:hypothetical protein